MSFVSKKICRNCTLGNLFTVTNLFMWITVVVGVTPTLVTWIFLPPQASYKKLQRLVLKDDESTCVVGP